MIVIFNHPSKLQFHRAKEVNSTWALYPVKKCLYRTDNLQKAHQKERKAEEISNLESSGDEDPLIRKRCRPTRFCNSSEDDDDPQTNQHERPPKINFKRIAKQCSSSVSQPQPIKKPYCKDAPAESYSSSQTKIDDHNFETEISRPASSANSTKTDTDGTPLLPVPLLVKIKQQNKQIIELLQQKGFGGGNLPQVDGSIVTKFPAKTIEDLLTLDSEVKEEKDKTKLAVLISYLSSLGGDGVVTRTNKILKSLMINSVASQLNFKGRNKQAFSSFKLNEVIIEVVKSKIKTAETHDIETAIKNWLKHAPQRQKLSEKIKD